jgi:hypothetical protein
MEKLLHNVETGEISLVPLTDDEIKLQELRKLEEEARKTATATKATEKAALLAKLGITEDEARLLLG